MSEVRSNELDTRLSFSGEPVEGDTAVSTPREVRAFYALEEACGLDVDSVARFKDIFQFPKRVRVCRPSDEDRACHFFPGEICFHKAAFSCGLRFPRSPVYHGATGSFWHCFWTAYAKLVEDSGQLYGDMVGRHRGYD